MILKRIIIQNLGTVDAFECDFENDLNIVRNRYTDEISGAIQFVLNHRAFSLPMLWVRRSTKIEALVGILDTEYLLRATPNLKQNELCLRAYDADGHEKTREYLYLTSHCAEQDLCEVFDKDTPKIFFKPIQYLDEDHYYSPSDLSKRTDRFSETKTFRSYLKTFIKDFKSETIRDGKRYELYLKKDGRYAVRYKGDNDMSVFLSESEQTLFRYLCFLRTAEFWQGFEELRNLHAINKPILMADFLERLDESIDTQDVLERTKQLNRQIIMLTI
jgi:hypothetical protein